ncbi:MAG: serine--tRNA ligase [Anaerolineae bacterium]|jgi:seryl-tRNA synthetase|nr:serine--tRNA ligase [Anaerolineae bacterium]
MIDINLIRENPEQIKAAMVALNTEAPIDQILALDARRRELLTEVEALRAERNAASKEISRAKDPDERQSRIEAMRLVGDRIKALEDDLKGVEAELDEAMLWVPNLPHASVPVGPDDSANMIVRMEGEPRTFDFEPVPHWDLGPALDILDFERGVKLSGTRFYVLRGMGARLQRALIAWMLDVHREQGYTEIYPPYMVRREMMVGAAQLPKFEENIYHDAEEDFWFIGTAEIPMTNLHRDEILPAEALPLHYVAYTPCFRREKMSAGRDVRGMKRGHQFDKVEMYKLTTPETSYGELESMVGDAEAICQGLAIPYRLIQMCTGDLGFQAAKKYDLEVWAPGVEEWLEVSSLSNCTDFQARRANLRYRPEPGARPRFVHTLNGSGLALPRVMIAVMENYQQADGSIVVPEVLRPYMGGVEVIR